MSIPTSVAAPTDVDHELGAMGGSAILGLNKEQLVGYVTEELKRQKQQ